MRNSRIASILAASLLLTDCMMVEDPPSRYSFNFRCDSCRSHGVDTIEVRNPSVIRSLKVDSLGNIQGFELDGPAKSFEELWFGTHGLPLLVADYEQPDDSTFDLQLAPFDWGGSPLGDTILTVRVLDPKPRELTWQTFFRTGPYRFSYRVETATLLNPLPDGTYSVRLPRLLFGNRPTSSTLAFSSIYREQLLSHKDRIDSLTTWPSWPPKLDSSWVPSRDTMCWASQPQEDPQHQICVTGRATPRLFHRAWKRKGVLIGEDSGSWDPDSRKVVFVHRDVEGNIRTDSTTFDPHLTTGRWNWWYAHQPALEFVAESAYPAMPWSLFKAP